MLLELMPSHGLYIPNTPSNKDQRLLDFNWTLIGGELEVNWSYYLFWSDNRRRKDDEMTVKMGREKPVRDDHGWMI